MPVPKERLIVQLKTLMDLSATVNSTLDAAEIQQRAVDSAATIVDAERSSLLVLDPQTSDLCFEVTSGRDGPSVREVRLERGEGVAGWVVEHRTGAIIDDVSNDERYAPPADDGSMLTTRDMLCVPVCLRGEVIGALQAMNKRYGRFDDNDLDLLEALAHHVAVAIENANLYQEIKEAFYQTAEVLAHTIEKADPYTGEHIRRVMRHCINTARELGLSGAELENVRLAAVLHDVGKVGVPNSVLLKEGGLEDHEFELMKTHCTTGWDILGKAVHLHPVMAAVRGHHERVDGTGYPDGLKGDAIPLAARIIAVADAFDAMTSERPYRGALEQSEALQELRACSGTQFDPVVTEAFIRTLAEDTAVATEPV